MFCNNCGAKLSKDAKFCPNCGHKVDYSNRAKSSSTSNSRDAWSSSSNQKSQSITQEWVSSGSTLDGFSQWGTGKKLLTFLVCCCLGIYVLGGIGSLMSPDQNTATYEDSYDYDYSSEDSVSEDDSTTTDDSGDEDDSSSSDSYDTSSSVATASLVDDSSGSYDDSSSSYSDSDNSYSSSLTDSDDSYSSYNDYESEPVTGGSYVASRNSDKFHRASCGHASRIKESNRVYYSSREEAISAGKTPCKTCDP